MTSRGYNPETVALREDIVVTRKGQATVIANLPRDINEFRRMEDQLNGGLVSQLKNWWNELTNQRETSPFAQAA